MKKKLLTLSISILFLNANASNFNVIIDQESNSYDSGIIVTEESGWENVGMKNCEVDKLESNVYFNINFTQKETCTQDMENTIITKKITSDGSETIIDVNKKTKTEITINEIVKQGTHLESSCKNIKSFEATLPDGEYKLNSSGYPVVYCDMTRNGGGWMRLTNYDFNENPDNTPNGFVKTVNRTLTTYTGSSYKLTDGWYRHDVTNPSSTSFVWQEIIASTNGFSWTESMIEINSLQAITPDSYNVASSLRDSTTVNGQYLDGISFTYGIQGARKHIHSLTRTETGLTRTGLEWLFNSGNYTATEIEPNNQKDLVIVSDKVIETTESISARFALNQIYNDEKIGFTKLKIWIK